jgi:hypothetical protein
MTQDFSSKVHLLVGKLVLIVMIHLLRGSRTNRHHTPNLQPGATQPTQDGDPQAMSNPLEFPFMISHGEGTRTPHNPLIRAGDKHRPLLNDPRCSKSSRCRQTPRVTKEIHSETQSLSVSRCNHSSHALGCFPISPNDESIKQDELERNG